MPAKRVGKSREKSRRTMPGRNGGTLQVGGTNPGAGRPPNVFKARMMALADRGARAAEAQKILDDPHHPQWMNAWKFCAEQGYGKAHQSVDLTSGGEPIERQVIVIGDQEFCF